MLNTLSAKKEIALAALDIKSKIKKVDITSALRHLNAGLKYCWIARMKRLSILASIKNKNCRQKKKKKEKRFDITKKRFNK